MRCDLGDLLFGKPDALAGVATGAGHTRHLGDAVGVPRSGIADATRLIGRQRRRADVGVEVLGLAVGACRDRCRRARAGGCEESDRGCGGNRDSESARQEEASYRGGNGRLYHAWPRFLSMSWQSGARALYGLNVNSALIRHARLSRALADGLCGVRVRRVPPDDTAEKHRS